MALDAVVFPQEYPFPHPFGLEFVDPGSLDPGFGSIPLDSLFEGEWSGQSSVSVSALSQSSPAEEAGVDRGEVQRVAEAPLSSTKAAERPKRKRPKSRKSREDIENQRMTHIAVERNRRKQMNEYLSSLRSLMPESYCQRSDQASIVGSAINFVKELEYKIRLLEARRDLPITNPDDDQKNHDDRPTEHPLSIDDGSLPPTQNKQHFPGTAEVEASMVESHASLKIRSRPRPKQLLKLISGLQALRLTVLHLDILTVGELIHYSISLKAEDHCKLTSGEDISSAVHRILLQTQE
ncbi:hypothetical protein MLD38_039162 [Melastoma candidum]|uniref:Uncharacterized protein n=1 Tax=Melastoma candidum TaxID=119954 RepID=A0ACB9L173_9MYRT|nr:hypothetical protein MLD38_039162 [Melastoma candidum]